MPGLIFKIEYFSKFKPNGVSKSRLHSWGHDSLPHIPLPACARAHLQQDPLVTLKPLTCLLDSSELPQRTQINHSYQDNRLSFPLNRRPTENAVCKQDHSGALSCKHWGFPQWRAALRKTRCSFQKVSPIPGVQTLANPGIVSCNPTQDKDWCCLPTVEQATATACCLPYRPPEYLSQNSSELWLVPNHNINGHH